MNNEKFFNQQEYINKYNRENYKQFKVHLKKEEKEELDLLIKQNGFNSNSDFLRKCIEIMKSDNSIIKK